MKPTVKEVTDAVELLMGLADQHERGQIVPWNSIEAIAGSRFENRGRHVINKWRRKLEKDREIVTLVAESVGVRLLTHQETAKEIPALRQRKAYRQVRRAIRQVGTVDAERLSMHERKILAAQQQNMAAVRRELFRSRKQLLQSVTTAEVMPRRAVQ